MNSYEQTLYFCGVCDSDYLTEDSAEECCTDKVKDGVSLAELEAKGQKRLPTISEMSGLVHDFTNGKSMREYMDDLSNE